MFATLLKKSAIVSSGPGFLGLGLGRILPFRRNGHSTSGTLNASVSSRARASTPSPTSSESTKSSRYFICDNAGSVARARQVLKDAPYVLFDCEGHDVKTSSGSDSVSLVQMGTPHAEEVFIFDMLALGNRSSSSRVTKSVLSLLSSPRILKVGWGGVQDYSSLSRIYRRPQAIKPFLDLQLVDIHSRLKRREGREGQVKRLATRLFPEKVVEKMDVGGVHGLSKMDDALVEHRIGCAPLKESHRGRWTDRPLNLSDIRYAFHDIVRISELHNHFRTSGYLTAKLLSDTIAQTAVYMNLFGPSGILNLRKRFVPPNILPLDILDISVGNGKDDGNNFFTRNRDLRRCRRCHRALSLGCFPESDCSIGGDWSMCKVCLFILEKERYIVREAARRAKLVVKEALKTSRDLMN